MSISPTFYKQPLHMQMFCASFICLQFGFVIFWQKEIRTKAVRKMMVKLTSGLLHCHVNFVIEMRSNKNFLFQKNELNEWIFSALAGLYYSSVNAD